MLNGLLALHQDAPKLILSYGACAAIILAALFALAWIKNHKKRQMRPVTVKKSCGKAKAYAQKILNAGKGEQTLLGSTHLVALSAKVSETTWLAFQIAETKKDLAFEGMATSLDGLATVLAKESEVGFLEKDEYELIINNAIAVLDGVMAKLDKYLVK